MRVALTLYFLALTGCGGCGDVEPMGRAQGPITVETPSAEAGDESGHPAYREAYERASGELTVENAPERLETLNREIEKDSP